MTTKRITLACLIFAGLIAISATALRAQSFVSEVKQDKEAAAEASEARATFGNTLSCSPNTWYECLKERQSQQLEGSWDVTVTPVVPPGVPQPPSFIAHATFSRGGGYFGSDRTRPLSKQHGTWAHIAGNEFAGTFTEDLFDATGNFAGTLKVRTRTIVTGKDEYVGVANGERRDASGNLTLNACTTFRGKRIIIEPLPAQCQSINPFQ